MLPHSRYFSVLVVCLIHGSAASLPTSGSPVPSGGCSAEIDADESVTSDADECAESSASMLQHKTLLKQKLTEVAEEGQAGFRKKGFEPSIPMILMDVGDGVDDERKLTKSEPYSQPILLRTRNLELTKVEVVTNPWAAFVEEEAASRAVGLLKDRYRASASSAQFLDLRKSNHTLTAKLRAAAYNSVWGPDGERIVGGIRQSGKNVCKQSNNDSATLYRLEDKELPCKPGGGNAVMATLRGARITVDAQGDPMLETSCDVNDGGDTEALMGAFNGKELGTLSSLAPRDCVQVDDDTIVVINPRMEYLSNIYHNMEEVFSIYRTVDVLQRQLSEFRILFVFASEENKSDQNFGIVEVNQPKGGAGRKRSPYPILDNILEFWGQIAGVRFDSTAHTFTEIQPRKKLPDLVPKASGLCFRGTVVLPLRACSGEILTSTWSPDSGVTTSNALAKKYVHTILGSVGLIGPNAIVAAKKSPNLSVLLLTRGSFRAFEPAAIESVVNGMRDKLGATVLVKDFATIGWREQMRLIRESDLLIGAHGAGLSQVLWLREGKGLIEITEWPPPFKGPFPNGGSVANIFMNMAAWTDHPYHAIAAEAHGNIFQFSADEVITAATNLLKPAVKPAVNSDEIVRMIQSYSVPNEYQKRRSVPKL